MIEFRQTLGISPRLIAAFFARLTQSNSDKFFHPHPLDDDYANHLFRYVGKDLYFGVIDTERMIGYGILRGWDEGFDVPSLGIALDPEYRGRGIGEAFMHYLHVCARFRNATRIRLTVNINNPAVRLYRKLGYVFDKLDDDRLVGFVDL